MHWDVRRSTIRDFYALVVDGNEHDLGCAANWMATLYHQEQRLVVRVEAVRADSSAYDEVLKYHDQHAKAVCEKEPDVACGLRFIRARRVDRSLSKPTLKSDPHRDLKVFRGLDRRSITCILRCNLRFRSIFSNVSP